MADEFELRHSPYVPLTDEAGRSLSRIQPYPPMLNPCRLCPARCCHTTVKATLPDVIRYCRTLDLPALAGFALVPSLSSTRGFPVVRDARFVDPEDGWPGRAELALRRRPGGACQHIVELGGYLRCGVYGARPMNCRLYPVSWEDAHGRGGPDAVLCPAPFAVTPEVGARAEADARQLRREWAIHEAAIRDVEASLDGSVPSVEDALRALLERAAELLDEDLPACALATAPAEVRLTEELVQLGIISGPRTGG